MCCSSKISASFVTMSILALVSICILSIIDLIFASLTPLKKEQFIMSTDSSERLKDYSKEDYLTLLNDLEFGQNLYTRSNYGLTGNAIKEVRFTGQCSNDNSRFWATSNCSESCFDELDSCYDENEKKCSYMKCINYNTAQKICKNYNVIYKWRNYELNEDTPKFYYVPLYDIINLNGKCRKGYKLCGKTNEINYLCLLEEDKCPINKIILNNDKNPPTDF